jgi:hypothetical protein
VARRLFLRHEPYGCRGRHLLRLPGGFPNYLARFRAKKRYNLQRQARLLRDRLGGELRLERLTRPEEVPAFLEAAGAVEADSWQGRLSGPRLGGSPASLADAARRGLVRSYLLSGGGVPCAFVVGYQAGGVYEYHQIGYRRDLARFSPGTTLLYLLLEDLFAHGRPDFLNFGWGDDAYKSEFGNEHWSDAAVLLLRRTAGNRWRRAAHAAFRGAVGLLRDGMAPRSPDAIDRSCPQPGRPGPDGRPPGPDDNHSPLTLTRIAPRGHSESGSRRGTVARPPTGTGRPCLG